MNTIPDKANSGAATSSSLFADLDRRRRFSCLSCQTLGCFGLLMLVLVVGAVATTVAATGIIQVPGLSALVYPGPPAPIRVVNSQPFNLDAAIDATPAATDGTKTLTVSEGQLTSLVAADRLRSFRQAQVAVDVNQVELYGYFVDVPWGNPVVVRSVVALDESGRRCTLQSLAIGRLALPTFVTRLPSFALCDAIIGNQALGTYTARALVAGSGSLTATLEPNEFDTAETGVR